jgi:hypothetical protein
MSSVKLCTRCVALQCSFSVALLLQSVPCSLHALATIATVLTHLNEHLYTGGVSVLNLFMYLSIVQCSTVSIVVNADKAD